MAKHPGTSAAPSLLEKVFDWRTSLEQSRLCYCCRNMVGTEFVLAQVQDPIFYVIKKQHRSSPEQVTPIAAYYILAGTVYQAPDLWSVINSRLLNTAHFLHSAVTDLNSFVRYHPSSGYYWEVKNPNNGNKISFVPTDPARKVTEDSGTAFQRNNVDALLGTLTQKYPPKPMPATQHPYGPRVPKDSAAGQAPNNTATGATESVPPVSDQRAAVIPDGKSVLPAKNVR